MKYINNRTFEPTPGAATRYLNKLGIYDIESFLYKPKPSDYISPWSLNNMEEMVAALNEVFTKNKKIFLQVDSDTDGITSSAIFYNFFTSVFPEAQIEYRVHEGKEHGVILDTIPVDAQVIVIPDAGSNQLDEQEALAYQGRTVLIMDHHVVNHFQDLDNVIIVNNQTSELYHNKNLSGAGVVYKVIEAYCQKYLNNEPRYKNYEDLAALGIIADCMDCRTLDNNAIVMNGLNRINNPMLAQFLEKQSAGGLRIKNPKNPTKIDIAFYVAPLINAVIRSGTLEEKTQLFESFIGVGYNETFTTEWRGEIRRESLYEYVARTAVNLRARQNRMKEKSIESLVEMVEKQGLQNNKVLILKVGTETVHKNITGLVAMDMVNTFNKPTLVLRPVVETRDGKRCVFYRGSGRAQEVAGFNNFMAVLQESGLMEYVEGHENAFGASVLEENIPALTEFLNDKLADIDFANCNFVDCCLNDRNWNNVVLKEFGAMERIYGNGIPEPKFHLEFDAKSSDFRIQGSNNDSLKISHNGTTLIKFKCADLISEYKKLAKTPFSKIHVEVIGTSSINSWNGYDNVQIKIQEIELTEVEETSLF